MIINILYSKSKYYAWRSQLSYIGKSIFLYYICNVLLKMFFYCYSSFRKIDTMNDWCSFMKNGEKKQTILVFVVIWIILASSTWYLFAVADECTLGIEHISQKMIEKWSKKNARIGLVTNQTGTDHQGRHTVDILVNAGLNVTAIFAPEHGFSGTVLAGENVHDEYDLKTAIPIVSLYTHGGGKKIDAERMETIDLLIYDLQDCGMRHYTYISLLLRVMQAALEYKKIVVVLDRPNPLGGLMEGPLVEPSLISFISIAPIPLRHGMTIGELAWYFNTYILATPINLHVVPMHNYHRSPRSFSFLAPLSPNIGTIQSLYGYSFLGLMGEIAPFDVGVGTSYAFQLIGLPESMPVTWQGVKNICKKYGIESTHHSYYHERKKKRYAGLILSIPDSSFSSLELFLELILFFKKEGVKLSFSASFDKAAGSSVIQELYMNPLSRPTVMQTITQHLNNFYMKCLSGFLYTPFPTLASHP